MATFRGSALVAVLLAGASGLVSAQHVVRYADVGARGFDLISGALTPRETRAMPEPAFAAPAGDPVCGAAALAWQDEPMPPGETGTLNTLAFARPATLDNNGRIAFVSQVDGSTRNQGVFVADDAGLRVIAMGCGNGGGSGSTDSCGDPSPIGGNFSGFFPDTWAAPATNDYGDVLFVSDVAGGSAPRGLFLYVAVSDSIVKIAAVGDASPLGGTLSAIGPGSINNAHTVAFLASTGGDGSQGSDILLWEDGIVTAYVAAGDPAPGGGVFNFIGTEAFGYLDGTWIPTGPVPGLNDSGQIAFQGITNNDVRGELLSQGGVHEWQVQGGDPAPGGGNYLDFMAPVLNNNGEIAFFSDLVNTTTGAGWFVGSAGNFRRAFAFLDPLGDGIVWGMAVSRNPFHALDDAGNLVAWTSRQLPDTSERDTMIVARPDGTLDIVAGQGDATPFAGGGTWGGMDGWPTMNFANELRFGAATPGNSDFVNTHVRLSLCVTAAPSYTSDPPPGSALDFGEVPVGIASAPRGIDVGNHGTGPAPGSDLSITAAVADDPAFVVTLVNAGPFPAGTDPDGSADIEVRCAPGAAGPIAGTLTVSTNDPAAPGGFTYPLACTGIDDIVFRDGFDGVD
jgi:hypothetical protein